MAEKYKIGDSYVFDEAWSFSVSGHNKEADMKRLTHNKMLLMTAAYEYEFSDGTKDWVWCPVFLPIELLGYNKKHWELDQNYIYPFYDQDEKYPNNPDYSESGPDVNSFAKAEAELYYDIKIDVETFPDAGKRNNRKPYILLTNMDILQKENETDIWLQLSASHAKNIGKAGYIPLSEPVYRNTVGEIQYSQFIKCINIALSEEFTNKVFEEIKQADKASHPPHDNKVTDLIWENVTGPFVLESIIVHRYGKTVMASRFDTDIDSNANFKGMVSTSDIKLSGPVNYLERDNLLEERNPKLVGKTNVSIDKETFGIFSYETNPRYPKGEYGRPEQRQIKLPLIVMRNYVADKDQ